MSALSRTPRSMAEMLIEVSDQRNTLALALRDLLAAIDLMNAAMDDGGNVHGAVSGLVGAKAQAHAALARVPYTVLLARKPE